MAGMSNKRGDTKRWLSRPLTRFFNRRDFQAAERYWSPGYVQHSAGIGPGRDGLSPWFTPFIVRTRVDLAVAEGDYVMVHGRYSGGGRPTRIVVDILRIEAGRIVGALGRHAGRSARMESKRRSADVWRQVPGE